MKIAKHVKRLTSLALSALMVISVPPTVFAKEVVGTTPVSYVEGATYTVSIPQYTKAQEYGEAVNTSANTVKIVSAQLTDGTTLAGTVSYSGAMTEKRGATIPYKLVDTEGDVTSGNTIITHKAGTPDTEEYDFGVAVTEKAKYSGSYTDTAVFSFDIQEKTYTAEEIAADEHLYGIGKTKSEYVVAKFNDDYSSVTILKNGKDSDGLMKDYQTISLHYDPNTTSAIDLTGSFTGSAVSGEVSPMAEHGLTLNTAIIKTGVKNIGNGAFIPYDLNDLYDSTAKSEITSNAHPDGTIGIRHISIADTVETIGDCAFMCNTGLRFNKESTNATSIAIPNSVKSIGRLAFSAFSSITVCGSNFKLSASYLPITFNEGLETIDELAFACNGVVGTPNEAIADVKNVNSSDFNTTFPSTVKNIEAGAFSGAIVVGDIEIIGNVGAHAFNPQCFYGDAAFTSMGAAYVNALKNVTVSGDIGDYAFANHISIDTINLLDGCTKVGVSAFTSYKTLNIGSGLKEIAMSADASTNYTKKAIKGSFSNYEGFNTSGSYAAGYPTEKDSASRCVAINVSADNQYFSSLDGVLFNKDQTTLITYPAGKTSTSKYGYAIPKTVKTVAPYSFEYTSLSKILVPSSVTSVAVKSASYATDDAFYNCVSMPAIVYGASGTHAQTWASNKGLQFVDCQDAYREPQTVTVSYDANGGKGTMSSYTVTTVEPFNQMEFTLALKCSFTKDGYDFAGWAFRNNVTGEYLGSAEQPYIISAEELEGLTAESGDSITLLQRTISSGTTEAATLTV